MFQYKKDIKVYEKSNLSILIYKKRNNLNLLSGQAGKHHLNNLHNKCKILLDII